MKKMFVLSMLTSLAMVCSCQKQDSVAEQQLAQQKAEADARDKALDERLNSLDEKVSSLDRRLKALAENENTTANTPTTPDADQGQTLDPAQVQAEKERAIQEFSAQMRALAPNDSKMESERERKLQDPSAQRQAAQQESQKQQQYKLLQKKLMSGGAVFPSAESSSPTPSPVVENTLPTASPTP